MSGLSEAIRARVAAVTEPFLYDPADIAALLAEVERLNGVAADLFDECRRLRRVVADEVDRFDRECDRGDAARAEVRRLTAQQDKIRALIADSAFATITGQATEDVTPVVRVADVLRILGVEGNGA